MNKRLFLYTLLFSALLTFGVALTVVLVQYALPKEEWVQIGISSDFPPSLTPYKILNPEAFLVHQEDEWIVLSSHSTHPAFEDTCLLAWVAEDNQFRDPCSGATFALDGRYLDGPSPGDMNQYSHKIEGNEIWVETTRLIPGNPIPASIPGTPLPVTPPDRNNQP